MRRLLLALTCATLVLPACGDDDDGERAAVTSVPAHTTVTTSSTTTTEAPVPPPDVIPADESQITEQYVEQVLNALYEVSLEAILLTREAGAVTDEVVRVTDSISSPEHSTSVLNGLITMAADGFPELRIDPSPVTAQVRELHQSRRDCLFAEVEFDRSGLFASPADLPREIRGFVRLRLASPEQLATGRNPTAWVVDGLPATDDGSVAIEDCDQE